MKVREVDYFGFAVLIFLFYYLCNFRQYFSIHVEYIASSYSAERKKMSYNREKELIHKTYEPERSGQLWKFQSKIILFKINNSL